MSIQGHIAEALRRAQARNTRALDELEQLSELSPTELTTSLAEAFGYPRLTLAEMRTMQPEFERLSFAEASRRECVLLLDASQTELLVLSDPFDRDLIAWLELALQASPAYRLTSKEELEIFLRDFEDHLRATDSALVFEQSSTGGAHPHAEELSLRSIGDDQNPIVKLVNSTLYDALKSSASDIHLESTLNGLIIKYRIDGVLTQIGLSASQQTAEQVISRVKILAELDIAERRVPQDGRFKVIMEGREVDFRVSIMPSIFGEDAVLRILDKKALSDELNGLSLQTLGFTGTTLAQLNKLALEPYGMILVTGPTGSGKTTTLYAMISEINNGFDKIITIEDPVEYQLHGVLQIPVNEKKGLNFARGLRSILRHDPDKIMVGEVRDPETAEIAVQAALTGHLVLTTVHANNVFDVISRFIHMGVDPYSLVSAVNGILAQRLVRLNCSACRTEYLPSDQELLISRLERAQTGDFRFVKGRGCAACRGSGYKGRQTISELLLLSDEIRELVVARAPIRQLKEAARQQGMQSLRESALSLVREGKTTLEEINRVTFAA
jgi:general secretion pathway protein E